MKRGLIPFFGAAALLLASLPLDAQEKPSRRSASRTTTTKRSQPRSSPGNKVGRTQGGTGSSPKNGTTKAKRGYKANHRKTGTRK